MNVRRVLSLGAPVAVGLLLLSLFGVLVYLIGHSNFMKRAPMIASLAEERAEVEGIWIPITDGWNPFSVQEDQTAVSGSLALHTDGSFTFDGKTHRQWDGIAESKGFWWNIYKERGVSKPMIFENSDDVFSFLSYRNGAWRYWKDVPVELRPYIRQ